MSGHPAAGNQDPRAPLTERVSFSGWRAGAGGALFAILGFYAVVVLAAGLVGLVMPVRMGDGTLGVVATQAIVGTGGAALASLLWAVAKWRSWQAQGWPGFKPGMIGFVRGLGFGAGMAAIVVGVEIAVGGVQVQLTGQPVSAYATAAPGLIWWLAIAALGEELVFRGFPLSRLAEATGPVPAALILTTGFSALHLTNPGASLLGMVNVALASLVLSAAFFGWGGLPAAWGVHLGWNAGLALGADAPVSGVRFEIPGLRYIWAGPDWLSGGAFGPEGGLVASFVMVLAIVMLGRPLLASPPPGTGEGTGVRVEAA